MSSGSVASSSPEVETVMFSSLATRLRLRHGLQRWLVAFRADCEPGERKQWYVVLDAADYLADMDELRDLRTIVDALKLEERVREEGERCGR